MGHPHRLWQWSPTRTATGYITPKSSSGGNRVAGTIRITITGTKEAQATFARLSAEGVEVIGSGLYVEAQRIGEVSVPRAPIKDGPLRASFTVGMPKIEGTHVSVEFGYGGAAAKYAEVQHEGLDFNHPRGGEAKYLEKPVMEHANQLATNLSSHLNAWLRSMT